MTEYTDHDRLRAALNAIEPHKRAFAVLLAQQWARRLLGLLAGQGVPAVHAWGVRAFLHEPFIEPARGQLGAELAWDIRQLVPSGTPADHAAFMFGDWCEALADPERNWPFDGGSDNLAADARDLWDDPEMYAEQWALVRHLQRQEGREVEVDVHDCPHLRQFDWACRAVSRTSLEVSVYLPSPSGQVEEHGPVARRAACRYARAETLDRLCRDILTHLTLGGQTTDAEHGWVVERLRAALCEVT